jgi:hypothetical protein
MAIMAPKVLTARFRADVRVPEIDQLYRATCEQQSEEHAFEFDFSSSTFIHPTALLHLTALIARRQQLGFRTVLRLPQSRRVRDSLRVWAFPDGVSRVAGIPFWRIVAEEDHKYFGEGQENYVFSRSDWMRAEDPLEDLLNLLLHHRFFRLTTYDLHKPEGAAHMVHEEWARWRAPTVQALLEQLLRGRAQDLPRVSLYEVLANVVQHANARTACVISKIEGIAEDGQYRDNGLSMGLWDDGAAVHDTLLNVLKAGGEIRVSTPSSNVIYDVKAVGWHQRWPSYEATWTPTARAAEAEVLLSSLFPGITQKASRPVPAVVHPESSQELGDIGYGFHSLCRSVIDTFNGSFSIRCGPLHMTVRANTARRRYLAPYRVKITSLDGPPFPGNMITLRFPFRSGWRRRA